MGLRETKADRTRRRLVEVALKLFFKHGYDQVTMEQIAEKAEVGTSTLYRYFPSKDLLLLAPLGMDGGLDTLLRSRPADEPIDLALGRTIMEAAQIYGSPERSDHILRVRDLIDRSPGPRARLWDTLAAQTETLAEVIAERLSSSEVTLAMRLTANLAMLVLGQASDTWRAGDRCGNAADVARAAMTLLSQGSAIIPRVE